MLFLMHHLRILAVVLVLVIFFASHVLQIHSFVLELTYSHRIGFFPSKLPTPLAAAGVVLFPVILGQHLTWLQTRSVCEGTKVIICFQT